MALDRPEAQDPYAKLPQVGSFTVTSTDLTDGQRAYAGAAEHAGNKSPQLSWTGFPESAGAPLPGNAFQVRNDRGSKDYGGAYPPDEDPLHRYCYVVDDEASAAVVAFDLVFHTLARAQLVATFQR